MSQDHMNAYTPPVAVLDKLAEIVTLPWRPPYDIPPRLSELLMDPGVKGWILRMRELGRLPELIESHDGILQLKQRSDTSFTEGIRQSLNTPGPTQTMIDDAGPPGDFVDTQLRDSIYQPLSLDEEVVDNSHSSLSLSLDEDE